MSRHNIVQTTTQRRPGRFRGVFSSDEYNSFQDSVVSDITELGTAANTTSNQLSNIARQLYSENQYLKRQVRSLEDSVSYREFVDGKNGDKISRKINFHNSKGIFYSNSVDESKRAVIKSAFGEIYMPANGIENKFYSFSLRNNSIVLPDDLTIDITGNFDKVDGNGLKDYEFNGEINEGEIFNAFNSIDESVWVRTVTFPLESKIEEVELQMTVVVPSSISPQSNLIEVVPFPEGTIDITSLATAPDLGSTFQEIDGFQSKNNMTSTRYHFSPRDVEQVRIRIRCRDWIELGGKKVFVYGLRELGLKLIDYSKIDVATDTFGKGITAVVQIDSPTDHAFKNLYRIDPTPNFFLEDASNRHVFLKLSTTPDHNGVFWDSTSDTPPQLGLGSGIDMNGTNTIYAIYALKFVDSSGGLQSPFPVGTTPTVKSLGLTFTTTPQSSL